MTPTKATPANHWAKVPRKVVIHRMETAECLESRVFWAIILWSWCGPQADEAFVVKDAHGWIQRDAAGNPIPGAQQDILRLLGLGPGMKGNLSRAIKRLKEKGSIRIEGRILYPVREPPTGGEAPKIVKTDNWTIAGITIRSDNFPTDPVARAETVEWLTKVLSDYNNAITAARSGARQVLRQGLFDRGIITVLEEQKSREEESQSSSSAVPESSYEGSADDEDAPPPSTAVVVPPPADPPAPVPPPATWETFKEVYPPDHLDGPKAKPLFEALSPENKRICIERLQVYRQSPRWKKSPQYIPLASNWLQSAYDEPPPPFFEPVDPKLEKQKSSILRVAEIARRMRRSPA